MPPAFRRLSVALAAAALLSLPALAQTPPSAPSTIGFMGVLTGVSGARLTQSATVTLSLYTTPTGGTTLWSDSKSVQVSGGLFSTVLGDTPGDPFPPSVDFSQPYFVGVRVGSDDEMLPRIPLQGVPYALFAHNVADGSITSAKLASDPASLNKVSAGALTATSSGGIGIGSADPLTGRLRLKVRSLGTEEQDQDNLYGAIPSGAAVHWQSFTAGKTGYLTKMGVFVYFPFSGTVSVYAGEGTSGPLLYRQVMGFTAANNMEWFSLQQPVPITSGNVYTWAIGGGELGLDAGNHYAAGRSGDDPGLDYEFSTYVSTEGPSADALFVEDWTGRVGIGTTSPAQKLSVAGTVESTAGGFKFPDGTTQTTAAAGGYLWSATGSNISSANSGNVGIGTSSPAARLEVNNGGGDATSLKLEQNGSNLVVRPVNAGGASTVIENTAGSLVMNPSGGYVGIGTIAPSAALEVRGGAGPTSLLIQPGSNFGVGAANTVTLNIPNVTGTIQTDDNLVTYGGIGGASGNFSSDLSVGNNLNVSKMLIAKGATISSATLTSATATTLKIGTGPWPATAGTEDLRIVRGLVNTDGSVNFGAGWTCTHPSTGHYHLTFSQAFTSLPIVTATPNIENITISLANYASDDINVILKNGSTYADAPWAFIAAGGK